MKLEKIHPTLQHAIGCFEGFRRLGFEANEVFFVHSGDLVFVVLRTQGKEFAIGVGQLKATEDEWYDQSTALAAAIKTGAVSEEDLQTMWVNSLPYKHPWEFITRIKAKGFRLPHENSFNPTSSSAKLN